MNNIPKIRFNGYNDAWEQRKLGNLVDEIGTGRCSFTSNVSKTDIFKYAVLGSTSIISYDKEYDHDGDFILTARVGANAGSLYQYNGKVKITDNTVYIRTSNPNYIFSLLTTFDLKKLSFGTGQPLIKASELKSIKMNVPLECEEQVKIGQFFKTLDNTIVHHQEKINILKENKKTLPKSLFV